MQTQPLAVDTSSETATQFTGVLDYVAPEIDPDTRTLPVRATVDNSKLLSKPEMFAHRSVTAGQIKTVLVPKTALRRIGETWVLYIARDKRTFFERRVGPGTVIGDAIEVKKGLKPGESYVVQGSLQLQGISLCRYCQ